MYQFTARKRITLREVGIPRIFRSLAALLCLASLPVQAADVATAPIENNRPELGPVQSVESLVTLAVSQNPELHAARTVLDAAQGQRAQAGRLANPSLQLGYATDQTFNNEGEQSFELGLAQAFPLTRRLSLEKQAADEAIRLAEAEIADQARLLRQEVEMTVYALAEISAQLALRGEMIELDRESLAFIESRIELGEASEVEANQLRLEIYSMEQAQSKLQNEQIAGLAGLRRLCGLPVDAPLDLQLKFRLPDAAPALPKLNRDDLSVHPAYQMKQRMLQLAERNLELARAERWADIEVEVFYEEERGMDAPEGLGRDRFFGVGLSLPLPLNNRNQSDIATRRADCTRLQWELKALEAKLLAEASTEQAMVERIYAQAMDYQSRITPTVASNLEVMKNAYTAGQIGLTELFRTQEQGLRIQSAQLQLMRELAESLSRWRAASGQNTDHLSILCTQ